MKARIAILILFLGAAFTAAAEINVGGGLAWEAGASQGSGTIPGNSPPLALVPQFYAEAVYRDNPTQWAFGVDAVVSGNPGISSNPELFLGTDFLFHFPRLGPADLAILIGGIGWEDTSKTVQGVLTQTGAAATFRFGELFLQGRGLYRFYWTPSSGTSPLGNLGFMVLGGYSFPGAF